MMLIFETGRYVCIPSLVLVCFLVQTFREPPEQKTESPARGLNSIWRQFWWQAKEAAARIDRVLALREALCSTLSVATQTYLLFPSYLQPFTTSSHRSRAEERRY
jgi:hypothetical protein